MKYIFKKRNKHKVQSHKIVANIPRLDLHGKKYESIS